MGRSPSRDESGLKKGPWTPEEDQQLMNYIHKNGHGSWRALPKLSGLNRCGKSCRLRWTNYLRPDIKRGKFSQEEEQTILNLHSILGNKWSAIASHLPGRTDNEIKNFWNTHLKKKLIQNGFDPMTHRPRTVIFSGLPHLLALLNLKKLLDHGGNISQPSWDEQALMRLQAEADQMAKVQSLLQYLIQPPQVSNINNLSDFNGDNPLFGSLRLDSTPFSSFPDLQIEPADYQKDMIIANQAQDQFTALNQVEEFNMFSSSDTNSPSPPSVKFASSTSNHKMGDACSTTTTTSNHKMGDACSTTTTTSYGGMDANSAWSDLLVEDYPFFSEIL